MRKSGVTGVEIVSVPNRGRDIGAFLSGFAPGHLSAYDLVAHLHGKRSPQLAADVANE